MPLAGCGQEGEGIRLILKMGGMTRFDCALGSHAMMRRAFSLAIYHAHQRHVFGNPLIQQPLMRHVLSRMALQLEGQTALLFRLARAWDRRADAKEALWARLFTPAAKFVICKRGIPFVAEAMEVLGGIGYCEESELPRLYREMPVNSIWEGSGNIMCLDVLRVLNKQAGVYDLLSEAFVEVKGRIAILIARFVVYSSSCVSQLKNWGERLLISYSCWAAVRKC